MQQYLELVQYVMKNGERKEDRTGTGTLSVFGYQMRFDLRQGFPILTTKKILFDAVVRELLWFLKGSTNINDGLKQYTPIWNAWADENGELGPVYGYQWRRWERFVGDDKSKTYRKEHVDQIQNAIDMIKKNPNSRRIIVNAWNVADIDRMALPPCHAFFQFYVVNGRLDCQLYQRSADIALGIPFNIASYALLLSMMAQECNLIPGFFVHTLGDAHIYLNHLDGLKVQLERSCKPLPTLQINKKKFWDLTFEDIKLVNYQFHEFIKFPIAV
ncbi:MAG: thymidylate synthase [Omnitrophica WOR_2 bacterium GWA2_47_8]|nr:MAG: thymidylate synthase [Omnitrophica WOR_2 bacterium GWA2_47_8]